VVLRVTARTASKVRAGDLLQKPARGVVLG
jgi:hypothetical protein